MKITSCSHSSPASWRWHFILSFLAAAVVGSVQAEPAMAEPKTHTVFMGADFTIEHGGKLYQVVDVTGDAFVIQMDGKEVRVPMSRGAAKVKVTPALKLTESSAQLDGVKSERAYTRANDPEIAFQRGLVDSARLSAANSAAANQATAGVHTGDAAAAAARAAPAGGAVSAEVARARENAAARTAVMANEATLAVLHGPGSGGTENLSGAGGEGNFDAMNVSFEVSASRALARPYVVIEAQYRLAGAAPGKVASWLYARALRPVGSTPAKVLITQGGFPLGFELQNVQIHLYDQGEEIATNVSSKRVSLTSAEARQFVLLDYVSSHKGATLAAAPVMGHLPADFPARLAKGELSRVVYVKVAADGTPLGSYLDHACATKLDDPYLGELIARLFFKPALTKGSPVEGVATVDFTKLLL